MENPATWNEIEKAIASAMLDYQMVGGEGISMARYIYRELLAKGFVADQNEQILGFDHVAVLVWDVELWTKRYEARGAKRVYDNPDMSPNSPSSAHLRGIKWGNTLIALLEPINREEDSQVYSALLAHGDHYFQHIALRVKDIKKFKQDMERLGTNFVGDILERRDAFGPVRQIFGQVFDKKFNADEGNFWEFVERSFKPAEGTQKDSEHRDFDDTAAQKLYKDVEKAAKSGNRMQFIE